MSATVDPNPTDDRTNKKERKCVLHSLPLYNRRCFFWGHCLKLEMCKIAFVKVFLSPEGSCYSHVNLRPAGQMIVI